MGGYELDDAISHYLRNVHKLAIGSRTAETIKIEIGSVVPRAAEASVEVRGRHLITGLPTAVRLSQAEVREAIAAPMREIMATVRQTLEDTPPELASDIARDGILLAGGGTLIDGMPELIGGETGMSVTRTESPLTCVAIGSGHALEHYDRLRSRHGRHPAAITPDRRTAN